MSLLVFLRFFSVFLNVLVMCLNNKEEENKIFKAYDRMYGVQDEIAEPGQYPYHVAIKHPFDNNSNLYNTVCGGAIITPDKVLTAGRCIATTKNSILTLLNCKKLYPTYNDYTKYYVVAGSLNNIVNYNEDGQWRKIKSAKCAPGFDVLDKKHDIAVVFLDRPYQINKLVGVVPFNKKHKLEDTGFRKKCMVTGFRRQNGPGDPTANALRGWQGLYFQPEVRPDRLTQAFDSDRVFISPITKLAIINGEEGAPMVCKDHVYEEIDLYTNLPIKRSDEPKDKTGVLVGIGFKHTAKGPHFARVSKYRNFIGSATNNSVSLLKLRVYIIYLGFLLNVRLLIY